MLITLRGLENKKEGCLEGIPSFILKDYNACAFVEPLTYLFYLILKISVFSEEWSKAKVCPILKKGDKKCSRGSSF